MFLDRCILCSWKFHCWSWNNSCGLETFASFTGPNFGFGYWRYWCNVRSSECLLVDIFELPFHWKSWKTSLVLETWKVYARTEILQSEELQQMFLVRYFLTSSNISLCEPCKTSLFQRLDLFWKLESSWVATSGWRGWRCHRDCSWVEYVQSSWNMSLLIFKELIGSWNLKNVGAMERIF